jgi:hypothetical protein
MALRGVKTKDIARKLLLSESQINYKISNNSFKSNEIFALLELMNCKFENLFKEENKHENYNNIEK